MKQPNKSALTIDNATQIVDSPPAKPQRISPIKLTNHGEIRNELAKIYRLARAGRIDTQDATRLAYILGELKKLTPDTQQGVTPVSLRVIFDDISPSEFQTTARNLLREI